jgi:hypothetical protein
MTMLTRGSCLSPTTAFSGLYDDYFTTALGCEWFPDPPPRNAPCGNTFYGWQSVSTGSGNMNNCGCSGLCGQDGNGNEIDPAFADSTGVTVPSDPSVGGGTFSFPPITMRPLASNPCVFTALIHSSDPAGFTTDERWTLSCTPGKALNLVITGTIVSSGGALVNSAGAGWSCNIGSNVCGQTYTLTSTGAGVPPVQVSFP